MRWMNREEAGEALAERLGSFQDSDAVIAALPHGGAIVGAAVARKLHLPFGLVLVHKIRYPHEPTG